MLPERQHVTLKTGVIEIVIIFHNVSNKCSVSEHFQKHEKISYDPKLLNGIKQ